MRDIRYIVFHCTAGSQSQTIDSIKAWWKQLGWKNPGYHILVTPDGTKHNLQPIDRPSNGVAGYNASSLHCCYVGGVDSTLRPLDNRTPAQKASMQEVLYEWHRMFPTAVIRGHRDFSPDKNKNGIIEPGEWMKACPSFDVAEWLDEIGFRSTALKTQRRTTTRVNLREGEGVDFKIIRTLMPNEPVKILATGQEWLYVETARGDKGWMAERYLK